MVFVGESEAGPPEYEVGQRVTVLYDPQDAARARLYRWERLWLSPLVLLVVGLAPILQGVGLAWLTRQRPPGGQGPAGG